MKYLEKHQSMIDDEVDVAKSYADMYCKLKESNPQAASQFNEMAKDEIDHYHKLNEIAQTMLEDNESRIIFDYLHGRNNKRIAECEMMLSM